MGEVKHTPGPWKASQYEGRRSREYNYTINRGGVAVLAEVFARDAMNTALDSEANARLIAAAPDLLAALKETLEIASRNEWGAFVDRAQAAIDKAESTNA